MSLKMRHAALAVALAAAVGLFAASASAAVTPVGPANCPEPPNFSGFPPPESIPAQSQDLKVPLAKVPFARGTFNFMFI